MLLCTRIRLEVSDQDAATFEFIQGKCRGLYNWWIGRLRAGEHWPGWQEAKKTLQTSKQHDPELKAVYGKLLHEVYFRAEKAMRDFFRRCQAGEKRGFPRFKPRHEFFTLCYPAMYIKVEQHILRLPTGGKGKNKAYPDILAHLTESAPVAFREVAISRDARGHYYASFVSERQEERREQGGTVAFDLGIKTLATGVNSDGRVYTIGGFKGHRWYNRQLDTIRSKRDRCKRGSRRYKHLSQVYQRVSQKKRAKRNDCLHKASHLISHKLVESTVVVGDLSQQQMVMNSRHAPNARRNREVGNDWCVYTFVQMLTYKCKLYGKDLQIISEKYTSQDCSGCRNRQPMPLWKRTYRCSRCGVVMDRDENSAHNILQRYLARLEPHTGDPVRCADVFTAINTFSHVEKGRDGIFFPTDTGREPSNSEI
jgi:putative transposase